MAKQFADVLNMVGSYGRYQFTLTIWVIIIACFFMGFSHLWVFITILPKDYWCYVPGRDLTRYTEEEWINLTIPSKDGVKDKCHHYDVGFKDGEVFVTNITKECSKWNHILPAMEETISTSKGWLCDKELYSTHILAAQLAGNSIGSAALPIIADRLLGRRKMFFVCCALIGLFSLPVLFVDNITAILISRFIAGAGNHAAYQLPLIICLELISPDKRALTSFYSFVSWAVGSCTNGLICWLLPNWWYLVFPSFLPYVAFFSLWWLLPESPRYLLVRGQHEECADVLMKIATCNQRKDVKREQILRELQRLPKDENPMSYREFLSNRRMVFIACLVSIISFASYVGYVSVIYNVKVLPDNYFLGNFILSLTELPSDLLAYLSAHYFGRKATSILGSLLLIPFCMAAPFYVDNPNIMLALGCLIKVFNTIIIFAVYVITPELFPTPLRSSILGIVVLSGMIGVAICPYLITLEDSLVYWVLFGFSIMMLLLSLPLPETIGQPLPQTFLEADNQIKCRPPFKWINRWNQHQYKPFPIEDTDEGNKLILRNTGNATEDLAI